MSTTSNIGIQLTLKGAEQVKQGLKTISGSAAEMARQFEASRGAILTTAAAVATATGIMVDRVSTAAAEIERFAMLAGSTPQEFQRMAAGAKSAGMDMEKYASTMKDVQDKIGDFLQTGGGELKDFFEKIAPAVGVTAEQFKNLSGPQALQLFYNSLQKANLSQKETVFWMESIADDATTLVPLLQNNGAAFDALADRAAKYGGVLSDYALAASKDFKGQTDELTLALQGAEQILAVGLMPTLTETARELLATADSAGIADTAATVIRTTLEALVIVASDVAFTFTSVGREIGGMAAQAQAFLSLDFARAGQIGAMMKQDAATARAELEAFQQRLLNAGQTVKDVFNLSGVMKGNKTGTAEYQAALNALIRMKDDGTVSASQFTAAIKGATAANVSAAAAAGRTGKSLSGMGVGADAAKKAADTAKGAADKARQAAQATQQAYQAAFGNAAQMLRELDAEEQNLNAAEKALADVMAGEHWGKWNEAQRKAIELIYQRNAATIARQQQEQADAKWASESADANANVAESAYEAANAAEAQRDAQLQANAAIGLTALEVANLEAARIDDTAAEKQRLAAIMEGIDPAIAADYRRQAQALTELAEAKRDGAVKDAMAETAKEAADEWQRTADKIEDALIDALMDGGKSGAEYIEDLFRTMVLRPVLQAIVSPVAGAVTSALGLPGGSAAGGGLMGLANTASGLNNLYNMGASAANWLGLGTATATGLGLSAAMGTGTALAATGTGLGLSAGLGAGYGFAAGGGLGLTAASAGAGTIGAGLGTSAAVTGAGAAATGGAMSTLGAAMPWLGGALIVDQLFGGKISSGIGKILGFGGDEKPRYRYQTGGGDFEDKVSVAGVYGDIGMHDDGSKNIEAADFKETFQAIADLDATIAATLSPDQNAQIKTALDNYVSGKNESTADYVADRMRIMADVIGGGVNELVDQFGGTSEELVGYLLRLTQAQPTIDALAFLGKSLGDTEASTLSAALAMENLVGGQQNLLALTGSFYQNFYTEAERTAHATQALTDAMTAIGVDTLPATREAFRDLVEAQDLTTESGRKTYAGLMGLSGAFASVTAQAGALGGNLSDAVAGLYKSVLGRLPDASGLDYWVQQVEAGTLGMQELADTFEAAALPEKLKLRILELTDAEGFLAETRNRELELMDPTSRALQEQIYKLEDYAVALKDAEAALESAKAKVASALNAVAAIQAQGTANYVNALQTLADLHTQVANDMLGAAKSLRDFIRGESGNADALFADVLKRALGGDKEAMQALPQAATGAMDMARANASTAADYAIYKAQAMNQLSAVATLAETLAAKSDEKALEYGATPRDTDPMLTAELALEEAKRVALAIDAPLTQAKPDDLITQYADAQAALKTAMDEYSAAQQVLEDIRKNTADTVQSLTDLPTRLSELSLANAATVGVIDNSTMPEELKVLAKAVTDGVGATINFMQGEGGDLPAAMQNLILGTLTATDFTTNFYVGADLDAATKALAFKTSGDIIGLTYNLAIGTYDLTEEQAAIALKVSDDLSRTVNLTAGTDNLSDAQRNAILSASGTYTANVKAVLDSATTDPEVLAMLETGAADLKTTITSITAAESLTENQRNLLINGASLAAITLSAGLASDSVTTANQHLLAATIADVNRNIGLSAALSETLSPEALLLLNAQIGTGLKRAIELSATGGTLTAEQQAFLAGFNTGDITKDADLNLNTKTTTDAAYDSLGTGIDKPVDAALGTAPDYDTAWILDTLTQAITASLSGVPVAGDWTIDSLSQSIAAALSGVPTASSWTIANLSQAIAAALGTKPTAGDWTISGLTQAIVASLSQSSTYQTTLATLTASKALSVTLSESLTDAQKKLVADLAGVPASSSISVTNSGTVTYNPSASLNSIFKAIAGSGALTVDWLISVHNAVLGVARVIKDPSNGVAGDAQNIGSTLANAVGLATAAGFSTGGYTGPGGKYEAAGVVHRGEVVFSQDDIARLGGVRAVEAIRTGEMPGYATGGAVGAPVVVPAPVIPGRVAMAPRPAAAPAPDPEQQERDAQARDQAQRDAQQQTQDLIAQLRQVNSNLTDLKRSVDKSGQSNDQMNNKIFNMADTTVKLLRKFDSLGVPVVDVTPVKAATEAA